MKIKNLFCLTFFLTAVICLNGFTRDNTQVGLPEGAIARLGKGGINIMRFSPDGRHLVVGTDVGVWLYDVSNGKETALLTKPTEHISSLAISSDGKFIASAGKENQMIQVWDVGKKTKTLPLNQLIEAHYPVKSLAFSGKTLISLDRTSQIDHWNVRTGKNVLNLGCELWKLDAYNAVAFAEDQNIFATGHHDGRIHLWDTTSGKKRATLRGHGVLLGSVKFVEDVVDKPRGREISALAVSPDGRILASGSMDKTVRLWDTKKRKRLAILEGHNGWINAVAISKDGKILASGDANKIIKLWDVETHTERATLIGHASSISALTFSPDARTLASSSYDGVIRFWNQDTGEEIGTFTAGHSEAVKAVAFSEDGTTLASGTFNGTIELWSLKTMQELTTFTAGQSDMAQELVLSPNATRFMSWGSTATIGVERTETNSDDHMKLWEIISGEEILVPELKEGGKVTEVAFSPDKKIIAFGNSHTIELWDGKVKQKLFSLEPKRPFGKRKLTFSPDGSLLATFGLRVPTQVWSINSKQDLTPFATANDRSIALAFSPNSNMLAVKYRYGVVLSEVTSAGIGEHSIILNNVKGVMDLILFSPDGRLLLATKPEGKEYVSEGKEYVVQMWDVETGNSLGTVSGHTKPIESLAFSPDAKTLASGSQDGTVLLWDWDIISARKVPDKIVKIPWKEDAEAVKNWLKENNYQILNEKGRIILREIILEDRPISSSSISAGGFGSMGSGYVSLLSDGTGNIRISITGIGFGDFTFDEDGNLQPIDLSNLNQ